MPLPPPVIIENLFSSLNIVLSLKGVLKILRFDHYPFNSAQSKTFPRAAFKARVFRILFPLISTFHLGGCRVPLADISTSVVPIPALFHWQHPFFPFAQMKNRHLCL